MFIKNKQSSRRRRMGQKALLKRKGQWRARRTFSRSFFSLPFLGRSRLLITWKMLKPSAIAALGASIPFFTIGCRASSSSMAPG